jgi:glycerophosphoryl diester phosphodiesterase
MNFSDIFNTPVIGHRGACAYAPENTLASFKKAIELGVTWIEFDVMQAACGELIIFHDETLERTTNGRGRIDQFSYSSLALLDAGAWFDSRYSGEQIPALQATLDLLYSSNLSMNIELKPLPGKEERLVKRLCEMISPYLQTMNHRLLFSSFSFQALHYLRQWIPNCHIGLLLHEWEPEWQRISQTLQCVSIHVNREIMTVEEAKKIKEMNTILLCYTVNDTNIAKWLYDIGVDAIFSDVPDQFLKKI